MEGNGVIILIIISVVIAEISGIGIIKLSDKQTNSSSIKNLGKTICILGIATLILGIIGIGIIN